jgi:dTDP-4-amino-4,6-dideoxygalactose transaminase
VLAARGRIFQRYRDGLAKWAERVGARLPTVPADCEPSYHMFYVILPTAEGRTALLASLRSLGILAVFHYQPLHLSEMGRRWGGRAGDCPVAESVSERIARLPFYTSLTDADQDRVIDAVINAPL